MFTIKGNSKKDDFMEKEHFIMMLEKLNTKEISLMAYTKEMENFSMNMVVQSIQENSMVIMIEEKEPIITLMEKKNMKEKVMTLGLMENIFLKMVFIIQVNQTPIKTQKEKGFFIIQTGRFNMMVNFQAMKKLEKENIFMRMVIIILVIFILIIFLKELVIMQMAK